MSDNDDLALLRQHDRQIEDLWRTFRSARRDIYDPILNRRAPVGAPEGLKPYAQGGGDVQTPMLYQVLEELIAVQVKNPTKIDCVCQEDGVHARADVEDNRIYFSWWLKRFNGGALRESTAYRAIDQYGLSAERLHWQNIDEPDVYGDLRGSKTIAEAVTAASKALKDRESQLMDAALNHETFRLEVVHPLSIGFWPLSDPTLFIHKTQHKYIEAKGFKNYEGKVLRLLSDLKRIAFVGEGEPVGGSEASGSQADACMVTVLRRARLVDGAWKYSEYVYTADIEQAEMVQEYDCPVCPFLVCAGGNEDALASDPHLRFKPKLMPLYVLYDRHNVISTVIMALGLRGTDRGNVFVPLSGGGLNQELMAWLEEKGLKTEVQGGQTYLTYTMPEAGSDELPVLPDVKPWPSELREELQFMLDKTEREIDRCTPSRWLTGRVETEDIGKTTAAMGLDTIQRAAQVEGGDLTKHDRADEILLERMKQCLIAWNKDGGGKKYPVVTSGDEPCLVKSPDAGKQVYTDYDKLTRHFSFIVKTRWETMAERAQLDTAAYYHYQEAPGKPRTITKLQLLKELGHDDPQKQEEELEKEAMAEEIRMRIGRPMRIKKLMAFMAMLTVDPDLARIAASGASQPDGLPPQMQPANQGQTPPSPAALGARPTATPPPTGGVSSSGNGVAVGAFG